MLAFHPHLSLKQKYTGLFLGMGFAMALVRPFYAPYLSAEGFFDWQITLMMMAFPIGVIFLSPFLGRLADSHGRKPVILIGLLGQIIGILLLMNPISWWVVVLARLISSTAIPAALAAMARVEDVSNDENRADDTGRLLAIVSVGEMIAPILGALLVDYMFIRAPFFATVFIFIFLFFAFYQVTASQKVKRTKKIPKGLWLSEISKFWRNRTLRGVAFMGISAHSVLSILSIFLPLLIIDELGFSYQFLGMLMFVRAGIHLTENWLGGTVKRMSYKKGILIGMVIDFTCVLLIFFFHSYWALLVIMFLWGLGVSIWNVSCYSLLSDIGEKEKMEGEVLTSYTSISNFGSLASTALGAVLLKNFSIYTPFLVIPIIMAILVVIGAYYLFSNEKRLSTK